MRRRMRILVVLFSLFLGGPIYGQDVKNCATKTDDGKKKMVPCNGISVGLPKVFDNRTLTLHVKMAATIGDEALVPSTGRHPPW